MSSTSKIIYPFAAVPNSLARGGHGKHLAVFIVILSHGECFASVSTLAKEVGCTKHDIEKALVYWKKVCPELGIDFQFESGKGKGFPNRIFVDMGGYDKAWGGGTPRLGEGGTPRLGEKEEPNKEEPIKNPLSGIKPEEEKIEKMDRIEFIEWTASSPQRHLQIIGEWARATKPEFDTKPQWRAYIHRYLRAAKNLVPFSDDQIIAGYRKLKDAQGEKWLHKATLETLLKFVV